MEPSSVEHVKTTAVRRYLTHWGPWMVIAYLGLVSVTVAGFVVSGRTVKKQATREAAVQRCLASRPTLRAVSQHIKGVNSLAQVFVTNAGAVVASTPRSDPAFKTRVANLARAQKALKDISAVQGFPVPTIAQCRNPDSRVG